MSHREEAVDRKVGEPQTDNSMGVCAQVAVAAAAAGCSTKATPTSH
jgi:hypothetical protein